MSRQIGADTFIMFGRRSSDADENVNVLEALWPYLTDDERSGYELAAASAAQSSTADQPAWRPVARALTPAVA